MLPRAPRDTQHKTCSRIVHTALPRFTLLALALLALSTSLHAQLSRQLAAIAERANGRVGVACSLPTVPLACNFNAEAGLPMQSVYKLPIAIAALHAVELGKLQLTTPIRFLPTDLIQPDQYSALQEAHPHGGIDVPVEELLRLAVSQSDGVASDMVLRTLGGPAKVEASLNSLGIPGIHIVDPEQTLGRDMPTQYRNDASAQALVALLRRIADNSPLNPAHTALLLRWMTDSQTSSQRIKALLPPGTVVAHKTGTSGTTDLSHNVTNDIALITLPDGRRLAVAVLVTDSRKPQPVREAVIAQIAQAIWQASNQAISSHPSHP